MGWRRTRVHEQHPMGVATAVALLVLAVGCRDGGGDTAEPLPAAGPPEVEVLLTSGARLWATAPALPVLVLGDALVSRGEGAVEPGRTDPLIRSTDGGRTWSAPVTPESDPGDPGLWELYDIDGLGLLAGGGRDHDDDAPPVIWVSDDDGATFTVAAGVDDGAIGGTVQTIVSVGDGLLGLGWVEVMQENQLVTVSATWSSTDRGRTWTRTESADLGDGEAFVTPAVVSEGVVLATTDAGFIRSSDGGRTWEQVVLPVPDEATVVALQVAGDVVIASGVAPGAPTFNGERAVTFFSTDAGLTWRTSDPLPSVPDHDGTGTVLGPLHSIQEVGDDLIAVASTNANNDRYVPYVLRSTDGGQTWEVSDLGATCPGQDASAGMSLAVAGDLVVAVYSCNSRQQTQILATTDGGRTWDEIDDDRINDRRHGQPFPSGDGQISLLAGRGAVVHITLPS